MMFLLGAKRYLKLATTESNVNSTFDFEERKIDILSRNEFRRMDLGSPVPKEKKRLG